MFGCFWLGAATLIEGQSAGGEGGGEGIEGGGEGIEGGGGGGRGGEEGKSGGERGERAQAGGSRARQGEEEERDRQGSDEDMLGARRKTIQNIEEDICDLGEICDGPNQVKLAQYPQHWFGLKKRSFNSSWFANFSWLEYSVTRDAGFCFSCRMFGKNVKL